MSDTFDMLCFKRLHINYAWDFFKTEMLKQNISLSGLCKGTWRTVKSEIKSSRRTTTSQFMTVKLFLKINLFKTFFTLFQAPNTGHPS